MVDVGVGLQCLAQTSLVKRLWSKLATPSTPDFHLHRISTTRELGVASFGAQGCLEVGAVSDWSMSGCDVKSDVSMTFAKVFAP